MSSDILVTGGRGLLGSALKNLLPKATYVSGRDYDFTNARKVEELFQKYEPKEVIHLAAKVAGVKYNAEHNAEMLSQNLLINTHLLEQALKHNVKKLVTVLSGCCFPRRDDERPLTEDDIHNGMPFAGHLGYGYAKRVLDVQIHMLSQQYGVQYSSITPATMFGPNDNFDLEEGHVVGSLIHKCHLAKLKGGPLKVWGTGNAIRQFIFSEDTARIVVEMLKKDTGPDTLVVVADGGISIKKLVQAIARAMDFKGPIEFDAKAPEGQKIRVLKSNRFEKLFPNFKFTPLEEALKKTADWFLKNKAEKKPEKIHS